MTTVKYAISEQCTLKTLFFLPILLMFFLNLRHPPRPTLFPYTTLFRSRPPRRSGGYRRQRPRARRRRLRPPRPRARDRKSTRLNSSHSSISYAVFCLKKKIALLHKRFLYAGRD